MSFQDANLNDIHKVLEEIANSLNNINIHIRDQTIVLKHMVDEIQGIKVK